MTPHAALLREALEYALKHITILDVREHIQQALSLPSPSEWRPIEDAPRDGTPMLGMGFAPLWKYPFVIQWDAKRNEWRHTEPTLSDLYGIAPSLSHFQPLPTPPETPRDK